MDIREIDEIGGKLIEMYEGIVYQKIFEASPFENFVERFFEKSLKYKSKK